MFDWVLSMPVTLNLYLPVRCPLKTESFLEDTEIAVSNSHYYYQQLCMMPALKEFMQQVHWYFTIAI